MVSGGILWHLCSHRTLQRSRPHHPVQEIKKGRPVWLCFPGYLQASGSSYRNATFKFPNKALLPDLYHQSPLLTLTRVILIIRCRENKPKEYTQQQCWSQTHGLRFRALEKHIFKAFAQDLLFILLRLKGWKDCSETLPTFANLTFGMEPFKATSFWAARDHLDYLD